jgi:hypothetical protein
MIYPEKVRDILKCIKESDDLLTESKEWDLDPDNDREFELICKLNRIHQNQETLRNHLLNTYGIFVFTEN